MLKLQHFCEEELWEIGKYFNLEIPVRKDGVMVKDGYAEVGMECWWRSEDGPEKFVVVLGDSHWYNMTRYPGSYQIREPSYTVKYVD